MAPVFGCHFSPTGRNGLIVTLGEEISEDG